MVLGVLPNTVALNPKTEIEPQWERSGHGRTIHPQIEANDTDGHGL